MLTAGTRDRKSALEAAPWMAGEMFDHRDPMLRGLCRFGVLLLIQDADELGEDQKTWIDNWMKLKPEPFSQEALLTRIREVAASPKYASLWRQECARLCGEVLARGCTDGGKKQGAWGATPEKTAAGIVDRLAAVCANPRESTLQRIAALRALREAADAVNRRLRAEAAT